MRDASWEACYHRVMHRWNAYFSWFFYLTPQAVERI